MINDGVLVRCKKVEINGCVVVDNLVEEASIDSVMIRLKLQGISLLICLGVL